MAYERCEAMLHFSPINGFIEIDGMRYTEKCTGFLWQPTSQARCRVAVSGFARETEVGFALLIREVRSNVRDTEQASCTELEQKMTVFKTEHGTLVAM